MNPSNSPVNQIIEKLKKAAHENKAFNDIFHVLAARQRARRTVTVGALTQRMRKEGFSHTEADYVAFIKLLGNLGLGKIKHDSKGRARVLDDVRVSLQSIGLVACGGKGTLNSFKQRTRFEELPNPTNGSNKQQEAATPTQQQEKRGSAVGATVPQMLLSFPINGKMVTVEVPSGMRPDEIAELVSRLSGGTDLTQ
jgi:hypothetical protein